jgi:uncharacterized protein (DUF362 family)
MKTKDDQLITSRREALKMFGLGSAALLSGGFGKIPSIDTYESAELAKTKTAKAVVPARASVSFTTGSDRRAMMFEVLKPFEDKIRKGAKGKQLIIKPNMVSTNITLCATHVDAIRGFLEFIQPIYKGQVIIAESSGSISDSSQGFKNYGYLDLQKDFDVKFVDLNRTTGTPLWILDQNLFPERIPIMDMFMDPNNYVVSLSRLKTHNSVIMTAAVKNMVMAAPLNIPSEKEGQPGMNYKRKMHAGGSRWLHYNMFQIAKHVRPDLAVIDGVEGMQGNGPNSGFIADHKIALAGEDFLAVDSMCAKLMDIPLENLGYLNYCATDGLGIIDREKIDIIGGKDPDKYIMKYKLHENIEQQLQWKEPLSGFKMT